MCKTVGKYIPESRDQPEVIEREYYGQGMIYKNWEAYYDTAHPDQVCYIPELSDSLYTRQDFLDICNGQPEIADRIFEEVDWQSPETCLEDQWYEELAICPDCKKWYWCYDVEKCPNCGNGKENEMDQKTEKPNKILCDTGEKKWRCEVNLNVIVTEEDIDDIMVSALEGGITYWCREAEVIGERLGEGWRHEQIARGGILRLYDAEDGGHYDLDREKFLAGLKKYLQNPLYDGTIELGTKENTMVLDCGMIDAPAADQIIQYALFGEIMYA